MPITLHTLTLSHSLILSISIKTRFPNSETPSFLAHMEQPEFYSQFATHRRHPSAANQAIAAVDAADNFAVDDLLDFSNDDDGGLFFTDNNQTPTSTDSSTLTALDSANNSFPNFDSAFNFSADFSVPCDELAELEWLSNFVEDSFSTDNLENLSLITGINPRAQESSKTGEEFQTAAGSVPAKAARSKRSRAAPCFWNTGISVLSPENSSSETAGKKPGKKKEISPDDTVVGRRCRHCATDKTPQWRTGPMGPKTLCNACGVRYKSGRLVPEYRPAASPTFVLTKHSNSHRKVMELRRQSEMIREQQQKQQCLHRVSNGGDYLIHQQTELRRVFE